MYYCLCSANQGPPLERAGLKDCPPLFKINAFCATLIAKTLGRWVWVWIRVVHGLWQICKSNWTHTCVFNKDFVPDCLVHKWLLVCKNSSFSFLFFFLVALCWSFFCSIISLLEADTGGRKGVELKDASPRNSPKETAKPVMFLDFLYCLD